MHEKNGYKVTKKTMNLFTYISARPPENWLNIQIRLHAEINRKTKIGAMPVNGIVPCRN